MGPYNKAVVAAVMGLLIILDQWLGISIGFITEEWLTMLLAVLTPIFVWAVPNHPAGWVKG